MSSILDTLKDHEVRRFRAGENLLDLGGKAGVLFVLIEGSVEVAKHDVQVAVVDTPGAVFGEISALLDTGHSADVRALEPTAMYVIEDPKRFLQKNPAFHFHVSKLLARRLGRMVAYLTNVKEQYQGHDHIGMVDGVLEALLHRQPQERDRPAAEAGDTP